MNDVGRMSGIVTLHWANTATSCEQSNISLLTEYPFIRRDKYSEVQNIGQVLDSKLAFALGTLSHSPET